MRIIHSILILISLQFTQKLYSQTGALNVKIDLLPELKSAFHKNPLEIRLMGDSFLQYKSVNYQVLPDTTELFNNIQPGKYYIHISLMGHQKKTEKYYSMFGDSVIISSGSVVSLVIKFPENCAFNRHSLNRICPKCKKSDKTIPIEYGLGVPLFDKKGNLIKVEETYPGGCGVSSCQPTWYCKRDKLKF